MPLHRPYRLVPGLRASDWMSGRTRLDMVSAGAGDVRVLLLHGSASGARPLLRLGERLAEAVDDCRAVAVSLAGYGSDAGNPSLPIVAQHLEVIAAAMGSDSWHLIGHSMGGYLALQTALEKSDQVVSLSLIEPVAFGVLDPVADSAAIEADRVVIESFAARREEESGIAAFIEAWNQSAWENLPGALRSQLAGMSAQIFEEASAVSADDTDLSAYRSLSQPILLSCGRNSPLPARRVVERLAALPAASDIKWLANGGHMSVLREPELFAPAIASHIRQSEADRN